MARIVIADAGLLIALAGIDKLGLLRQLFAHISIMDTVRDECLAKPGSDTELIEVAIAEGWLVVETLPKPSHHLSSSLGTNSGDSLLISQFLV